MIAVIVSLIYSSFSFQFDKNGLSLVVELIELAGLDFIKTLKNSASSNL